MERWTVHVFRYRLAPCSAHSSMSRPRSEQETPGLPLAAPGDSRDDSGSSIVARTVTSSGNESSRARPPMACDSTHTATPTSSPELQPLTAPPLRSPERYHVLGEH